MEEWRKIEGFPNYSVSTFGNARNDKKGTALKPTTKMNGNIQIGLYRAGQGAQPKILKLSRLIATAFIDNPNEKDLVDHIDRNKLNNNVSNLRWCTSQENNRNRTKSTYTSSQYKGVCWVQSSSNWKAGIKIDSKSIHIGMFKEEEDAARAYDAYILAHHLEEFCNLNNV